MRCYCLVCLVRRLLVGIVIAVALFVVAVIARGYLQPQDTTVPRGHVPSFAPYERSRFS